ncbi:MAG: Gfo/Idh/MocA family oxidoreductase [candidate division KSB1 bacterium]|nr:Gfo/Idh/MocA family oxidoreductase [candidate division KSB1 bacterium]MDZ7333623.1 Gfo/Idh/MocA family oxidoreductase [candidate division KSB1 bacterium]MDZ7357809.1 Gfo/Idh/MocA family oxidoreductase [candidate division KSB1 bacterium]MDZ7398737.1 Gfo/Idh/MocA family oxidoreductase [candidate division KSB1 bacterium]
MRPIRLGIIGCGIAARELHWPALQKLRDKFEIAAVCNHTEPKAKSFAELVGGVPYVLSYHDLLSRADIDAVDIVLPIHLNYQVTKDALLAGKHVIVEKPLAANLDQAKELLLLDSKFALVKMVAENFRYRPTFARVKQIIGTGEIGQPYSIFWNVFYYIDRHNKYAQTQWRIHHQYRGGFITDGGVHNIAVIRDLFGEIVSGCAFVKCINRDLGESDTLSFQFATEQNVHGVFNLFFSANGYAENRIIILGTKGSLLIQNNEIQIKWQGQECRREIIEDDGGYCGQFEDFYQAIRTGKPIKSSFAQAYQDLRTIFMALESGEKQQRLHNFESSEEMRR